MEKERISIHGEWSTRLAFILAATGSAVGLGNIWKFPYITGEYGGGAFVLVYLLCIALIGVPIMIAEILMGRRGRQSPINSMTSLAKDEKGIPLWAIVGWLGVLSGFLILSFYSVIAGWSMAYVVRTAGGIFVNATADDAAKIFSDLVSDPEKLLAWHTVFIVITAAIISRGVRSGLEKAVSFLMPALFVILLILVGYAFQNGDFASAVAFMFSVDFSKLTTEAILVAMGHAFFTLSLGMGAIMMYGSYLPQKVSIVNATMTIAIADTTVALIAGLAIFPIVFANGLDAAAGPGLIFQTLPIAFGQMPNGTLFGTLFFILVFFAALSSAISLVEPAVAWLVENRGLSRIYSSVLVAFTSWLLGIGTVLSFNLWSDAKLFDRTFFDTLDFLTTNIMLPLGGLLIAIFAGWVMSKSSTQEELGMNNSYSYNVWRIIVRYVSPLAVIVVFLNALKVI